MVPRRSWRRGRGVDVTMSRSGQGLLIYYRLQTALAVRSAIDDQDDCFFLNRSGRLLEAEDKAEASRDV
jgi:hypothetical protein